MFFATSHGKSPCDGIGGTVKRVVCQESLKHVTIGQIFDINLMYYFCKAKITGICFKREILGEVSPSSFPLRMPMTKCPKLVTNTILMFYSKKISFVTKFNFSKL